MPHVEFSGNQIFEKLPEALIQSLFEAGDISSLPGGTELVKEGDLPDRLFVVLDGEVEVYLPESAERLSAVRLATLGPGDCFGEYAFIDRQPTSASIRSVGNVEIYSIPNDRFQEFLDSHYTVASIVYRNLLRILVQRLRASNAELDLFSFS
ncbi:MAG: cyclic nucleotide-binding domain-containing protein [Gammaproteobacteria bacterium]|nr:cyclic nucleotide-binding domain-containing protein [Gammaproteobacteria bacterium]